LVGVFILLFSENVAGGEEVGIAGSEGKLNIVMAGQKRKARLRAGCPGHPRLPCREFVKTWMPGIADKFTQSAQA
jgi:hypothetical protein